MKAKVDNAISKQGLYLSNFLKCNFTDLKKDKETP